MSHKANAGKYLARERGAHNSRGMAIKLSGASDLGSHGKAGSESPQQSAQYHAGNRTGGTPAAPVEPKAEHGRFGAARPIDPSRRAATPRLR